MHAPPFRVLSMSRFGFFTAFVCLFLGTSVATYGQFSEQDRDRLIKVIEVTEAAFDHHSLPVSRL